MNYVYHYLGLFVFWGLILGGAYFGALVLWEAEWFGPVKRRFKHLRLAFILPFADQGQYQWSRTTARLYILMARRRNWDGWERNILAAILKRARKNGLTE